MSIVRTIEETSIGRKDYHINTTYCSSSDYDKLDKDYPDAPLRFKVCCRINNTMAEKIDKGLWVITSVIEYISPKL